MMRDLLGARIFISHASLDKQEIRRLARRIEAMGMVVWFDEEELRAGDHLPARLHEALAHSTHLLVLLSRAWFDSKWAREELTVFGNRGGTLAHRGHYVSGRATAGSAPTLASCAMRRSRIYTGS